MEETKKKKYAHLAMQFSLYILAILVVSFVLQNIFIVKSVKAYSQRDYSDFSEKVITETICCVSYLQKHGFSCKIR